MSLQRRIVDTDLDKFKEWLALWGTNFDEPTNEWEVLRYRRPYLSNAITYRFGEFGVVYRTKRGKYTFVYRAEADYLLYQGKTEEEVIEALCNEPT